MTKELLIRVIKKEIADLKREKRALGPQSKSSGRKDSPILRTFLSSKIYALEQVLGWAKADGKKFKHLVEKKPVSNP